MRYLGFLKFLKRDKKDKLSSEFENLDMPPAPPDMGDDFGKLPELPELPELDGPPDVLAKPEDVPEKMPMEEEKMPAEMPNLPELPKMSDDIEAPKPTSSEQMPKPEVKVPEILKMKPEITPYERLEKAAVREEREVLTHKEAKGPVFIRVERFRNVLNGISTIKSNLKAADRSLLNLNEIDESREKEFEKWKNAIADMQKKFIFIDKTLFKEG
ncbi:MAG: hypothetical protein QGI38_01515 [Candidatus Woesearchaeota archaeon]|nr:hypothetical protein [Candidatus Woesearchaeota archaeon]